MRIDHYMHWGDIGKQQDAIHGIWCDRYRTQVEEVLILRKTGYRACKMYGNLFLVIVV